MPPFDAMCSSAMRSSSSIEMPGSRCSATSCNVSWTSSPARAMPSISCLDLRMIMVSSAGLHRRERLLDLVEDVLDRSVGVDADDVSPRGAVVLAERRRLLVVLREPVVDRLGRVVGPVLVRRTLLLPVGYVEVEDDVDRAAELLEEVVERFGLHHRAREAVEHEPRQGVAAVEPVSDQPDYQLVVDEVAPVVDLAQLGPELRRPLLHLADHVAGCDVRHAVGRRDLLRLRALPRPLRPQDESVQRRNPSSWRIIIWD